MQIVSYIICNSKVIRQVALVFNSFYKQRHWQLKVILHYNPVYIAATYTYTYIYTYTHTYTHTHTHTADACVCADTWASVHAHTHMHEWWPPYPKADSGYITLVAPIHLSYDMSTRSVRVLMIILLGLQSIKHRVGIQVTCQSPPYTDK
jgi:hypothetical protein